MRIRSDIRNASHARNLGMRAATGEIIAFPDDDCFYPKGLLAKIDADFRERPRMGVQTGPMATPGGGFNTGRWLKQSGEINVRNVWFCSATSNIFIRRQALAATRGFDEQIGLGSKFGSGEDTDLVLQALETGWDSRYDVSQHVFHPDKTLTQLAVKRAFSYGAGFGYLLRKHRVPIDIYLNFLMRSLGGCAFFFAKGNTLAANYYLRTFCGRVCGIVSYGMPMPGYLPVRRLRISGRKSIQSWKPR
jgi:GT2 family glycosyltransferase